MLRTSVISAIASSVLLSACVTSDVVPTPNAPAEPAMRDILHASLRQGRNFLLNNQKEEGNFEYEYDFRQRQYSQGDNQVRQAGALWGLALIHHDSPSVKTREALARGFDFFMKHSKTLPDGRILITYPGDERGRTGTVSLVILALTEFFRTESDADLHSRYLPLQEGLLACLLSLRKEDGLFYGNYDFDGKGYGQPDPYANGEALLAMAKSAKYLGKEQLWTHIVPSAYRMHQVYVTEALAEDPGSATTKGFFQWGILSFYEIATSGEVDPQTYTNWSVDMAYWMIDVHKTLERTRNTAYAYEGIILAWELARRANRSDAVQKLGTVIEEGLRKLTSWQVGGPTPNEYLQVHKTDDPRAIGGVMNHRKESQLRIDVTQHQMHAVILALQFIYR